MLQRSLYSLTENYYRRCFTMYKGIAANRIVRLNVDGLGRIFVSGLVLVMEQ
jgi:hypothetical protein